MLVSFQTLFDSFHIHDIIETTLGANQWLDDYKAKTKYTWNVTGDKMDVVSDKADTSQSLISLTPMKIRTFVVKLGSHSFGNSIKPIPIVFVFTLFVYFFN